MREEYTEVGIQVNQATPTRHDRIISIYLQIMQAWQLSFV